MKKTKIICTMEPGIKDAEVLRKLIRKAAWMWQGSIFPTDLMKSIKNVWIC